jgi:hypothetical protein
VGRPRYVYRRHRAYSRGGVVQCGLLLESMRSENWVRRGTWLGTGPRQKRTWGTHERKNDEDIIGAMRTADC